MVKLSVWFISGMLFSSLAYGFEKLPSEYQITYGNSGAPIQVVEYFSFSCPNCLKLVNEDFAILKEAYVDAGKVYWTFHPDPADKQTLFALICLKELDNEEKKRFLEKVSWKLIKSSPSRGCVEMQAVMDSFGKPIPKLGDPSFWQNSREFSLAFSFLSQQGVVTRVPTVEINGTILDEFPSQKFLEVEFEKRSQGWISCE